MQPLVSILIPAYNAEAFLAQTLESALAQTWPRTEIIVVDDGSRDRTLEVAQGFEARGVRVVAQGKNRGQTATLNRCREEMSPEAAFVQYFDADDILAPDKIEHQVRRLMDEPQGTIATSEWERFYDDDLGTAEFKPHPDYRDYDEPLEWLVDDWTGKATMPPGAWLYPRSVVETAGPWHEGLTLNNDMEYFTRAVLASTKVVFCAGARWYYRSGHASLSGRKDRRALESQFEVIRLSTERLLAHEDTVRTRHAAACYWQSFLYMAYPQARDLVAQAEARVAALGGGSVQPGGGRPFRVLCDVLGWKPALRLQKAYYRLRYT